MKMMSAAGIRFITTITILATALTAWGQVEEELSLSDGDLPIFPNVLIILDTSGSMAEVPCRTLSGDPVPVGTKRWNQDIKVDDNGEPVYLDGNVQWIDNADRSYDPFAEGVDENVYLTGGNHPASKLYKAKLALNKVLPQVDKVNLGFATFLQARHPRVKALYYRKWGEKYEFHWIVTAGKWGRSPDFGPIDLDTGTVEPRDSLPCDTQYVYDDESQLPPETLTKFGAQEIRCAPIPLNFEDFPQLPKTDFVGADSWLRVKDTMKDVPLADGTLVTAYPTQFDYSVIWYPVFEDTGDERLHTWSYTNMTLTGILHAGMEWKAPNPLYPEEAEDLALNNLGNEFIPGTDPPKPELINFSGDDHLAFVHLPDPSYDDDPTIAQGHRDKILSYISLERVTDPTFDCRVAPNDGSKDCEFCPNRKDGPVFRQFTCMPFTDSVACGGYTPLSHTLWNAYNYYQSYFDQDLKSQADCRDNYIILFTDGRSNCRDKDGDTDREDPVKAARALNNLIWHEGQSDATKISVKTYVMGFGLDEESKEKANAIAKAGGTDHAYFVTSVDEIVDALRMILDVGKEDGEEGEPGLCRIYTRSDPVIVGKDAVYAGLFEYPSWRGHLKKYSLLENWWREESKDWYADDLTWYDSGSAEESGYSLDGDAGANLDQKDADSRLIYTADSSGKRQDFTSSAASKSADQKGTMENAGLDITGFDSGVELVNKIRNMDYEEGDCYEATGGSWKLGDIYHSTPVIVGSPLRKELDSFADRPHLVLVGANDGMLHAFEDSDGTELWSYIPNCLLGKLHNLKDGHTYGVDLNIKATDVEFDSGWRTVLMAGLREGGNHYFALDITETTNPVPLWEVTHTQMGQTWSTPSFGRIPGDQYVAFVGGGYDPADNVGNSFYIIDLQTGDFVKKFTGFADKDEDFPAQVRAVDLDGDGYIERVYFPSTKGKLYRLRIDPKTGIDDAVSIIFDPGDYDYYAEETIAGFAADQKITKIVPNEAGLPVDINTMRRPSYYAPAVMRTEYMPRNYIVHYGTGDEKAVLDTWGQDFFFEIEDRGTEALCKWVYVFDPGEKCLSRPMTFDYIVYFTTYRPGICTPGEGFIYGLTATSRLRPRGDAGLNHDLSGKRLFIRKCKIGGIRGIPSSPQVANGAVIGNSSRNPTQLWKLKIEELHDRIRSWQEVF